MCRRNKVCERYRVNKSVVVVSQEMSTLLLESLCYINGSRVSIVHCRDVKFESGRTPLWHEKMVT